MLSTDDREWNVFALQGFGDYHASQIMKVQDFFCHLQLSLSCKKNEIHTFVVLNSCIFIGHKWDIVKVKQHLQ